MRLDDPLSSFWQVMLRLFLIAFLTLMNSIEMQIVVKGCLLFMFALSAFCFILLLIIAIAVIAGIEINFKNRSPLTWVAYADMVWPVILTAAGGYFTVAAAWIVGYCYTIFIVEIVAATSIPKAVEDEDAITS